MTAREDPDRERKLRAIRRRRGLVRDQVVSVEHGTPGGSLGAPDSRELHGDQQAHAEKGSHLEPADDVERQ